MYRGEVRTPESLGLILQQGRALRGVSQRDLADEIGVSQKWVWEMESGKPGLLMERLFAMLKANNVHLFAEIHTADESTPEGEGEVGRDG
ncbi:MAG: hypothetical protein K0S37_1190 [Microbacterium sp.]|jgi:transcriptional regulator with XRE-family HTH domain|nr:hypothetical protein [Microbacterium sp.]